MNTTFSSNKNYRNGKISANNTEYDFSQRSSCGGYVLLFALIAVLGVIVWFIATHA